MKNWKVALLLIIISMSMLTGCIEAENQFFGIRVLDTKDAESFSKVTRSENGRISYKYQQEKADPALCAWGRVSSSWIFLTIINNSKKPIELNYFWDEYRLWTMDGTNYKLKIDNKITDYPDSLNPGKQAQVRLTGYEGKSDDVKFILVGINYGKVAIFLRRIEIESG